MRILVTGGSGFVGSHTVAAMVEAGHQVRILARTPAKAISALEPFGSPEVEVVQGDVLDGASVGAAIEGCDAVFHCANVYSLDSRQREVMYRTNVDSTDLVIRLALAAGCDPVVHVSSMVALLPSSGTIPVDAPLGTNDFSAYVSSKLAAEKVARTYQEGGSPVVTSYPGAVYGPHDPGPGEMVELLTAVLGNRWPFIMPGAGLLIVDVRWLARVHTALFEPGRGPRRINGGGGYVSWNEWYAMLRRLTGRWLPQVLFCPKPLALLSGWLATAVQRFLPFRLPLSYDGSWLSFHLKESDDRLAIELCGPPPPLEETVSDAIRWAATAGHIPRHWAGTLSLPETPQGGVDVPRAGDV